MLDLNRLYLLHELSILGTISRVAEARRLTRPAVSHQLLQLENEFGAVLFERSGRGVRLTATGRRLVSLSKSLFDVAESIESEMEASSGKIAGEVRIASFGSAAGSLIPTAVRELAVRHPRVDVHFSELECQDAMQAAAAKQVDLAVVYELGPQQYRVQGSLQLLPLGVDTFAVLVGARHRLARYRSVSLADLKDERWDVNVASTAYYQLLLDACLKVGFRPQIRSSCRNPAASYRLIAETNMVGVFPSLGLEDARKDPSLVIIPLVPALTRKMYIATVRESSRRPLIAAVIEVLKESMRVPAG
ncbi:MAG: LysR family transcriptional regulator [Rubrivivax sp.]